jgi:hypothetical protein
VPKSVQGELEPTTAHPNEYGTAVLFHRKDGSEYEVDGYSVRALFDPSAASRITEEADRTAHLVGAKIRTVRLEKGLTRSAATSQANIPLTDFRRIELGLSIPDFKALTAIAKAMKVVVTDLLPVVN